MKTTKAELMAEFERASRENELARIISGALLNGEIQWLGTRRDSYGTVYRVGMTGACRSHGGVIAVATRSDSSDRWMITSSDYLDNMLDARRHDPGSEWFSTIGELIEAAALRRNQQMNEARQ